MTPKTPIAVIAKACHEANRALTEYLSDVPIQPSWDAAPAEMIDSSLAGVAWRLDHLDAPASAQHDEWMRQKIAAGWVLGPTKDAAKKTHPALIPYDALSDGVKKKDALFTAIVRSLA